MLLLPGEERPDEGEGLGASEDTATAAAAATPPSPALLASCASSGGTRWEPTVGLGLQTWGNHSEEVQLSSAETALAGRASVDRDVAELTFGVTHSTVAGEAIRKDWFAGVKLALGELDSSDRFNFGGDGENVDELALACAHITREAAVEPATLEWHTE